MSNSKISALTSATTPLAGTEILPIVQSSTTKQVSAANLTAGRAVSMLSATIGPNALALSGAVVDVGKDQNSPTRFGISNQNSGASATAGINFEVAGGGWQLDVPADVATFANPLIGKFNNTEVFRFKSTGSFAPVNGAGIDFSATPGTGTSELLADYEEGTFTPSYTGTGGNPTVAYATQDGIYTKVGRLVTFKIILTTSSSSGGSGDLGVTGLPFAVSSGAGGSMQFSYAFATPVLQAIPSGSNVVLYDTYAGTTNSKPTVLALTGAGGSTFLQFVGQYFV
jgi:hypothetical protein